MQALQADGQAVLRQRLLLQKLPLLQRGLPVHTFVHTFGTRWEGGQRGEMTHTVLPGRAWRCGRIQDAGAQRKKGGTRRRKETSDIANVKSQHTPSFMHIHTCK